MDVQLQNNDQQLLLMKLMLKHKLKKRKQIKKN
jgi:hypothetical protein